MIKAILHSAEVENNPHTEKIRVKSIHDFSRNGHFGVESEKCHFSFNKETAPNKNPHFIFFPTSFRVS